MGFFENLGNWIWEGIILNVIFGAIGYAVLVALWTLLYLFLRYLSENQVYQGLLTTDDDHPVGVVFIFLITPVLVVGFIGLILGLLWACINALAIFVVNIIPFAAYIVSNMSSINFCSSLPTFSTDFEICRKTSFGSVSIFLTVML